MLLESSRMYLVFIIVLCAVLDNVQGLSCSSTVGFLVARQSAQSLLSPGFPSDYENNQNCRWLISTQDANKKIQIEVISVNLANWDMGMCEDYLEIKDGKDEEAPLIKKWCNSEKFQFKSRGQQILIKFVSDHHLTAPGFALKYYQIDDYKSKCDAYQIRTINIGENPVYLDLPMFTDRLDSEISCDYHLKSQFNDDVTIDLEVLTFSEILCEDGSFVIHDGPSIDSPVIIDWCYSNQPFRHLTSSGKDIFIRFRIINSNTDWLVFRTKVTTKFKSISCSDKSIPNLELMSTPTYFAYPQHRKSASTRSCPLRLWTEKQNQTVRLQVVSKEPPCSNRGVRLYDGFDLSSQSIGSLCDRTVFSSSAHNLVLGPVNDNHTGVVYIKASAVVATCNGQLEKRRAHYDQVGRIFTLDFQQDLNCTYLLESDMQSDAIEVILSGVMVDKKMFECNGDFVTLYNGDTRHSPVITTWCGLIGQGKRYASQQSKMLIVINTDSYHTSRGINITYYSVPQKGGCSLMTELVANSTFQNLTSPNYPFYYPMNSYCEYKISAPEDHFVQLEVVRSQMQNDCSDTVRVYNGFEKNYQKYIGRWCGDEKPKYKSEGRELLVVFSADDEYNSGGFQARFIAAQAEPTNNHFLIFIIVGSILFALFVIIAIIVIVAIVVAVNGQARRQIRNQGEATPTAAPETKINNG